MLEAIGLSLSGGGIRSAAFSLGVLQAMNQQDVINRVDYLSTVSGGGYIGAAMTATMSVTQGDFVFGKNTATTGAPPAADVSDTEAVAHIRNYSNYLIPFGLRDVLTALAIIVRGLVANIAIVLPLVLAAAAVTIAFNPTRSALLHSRLLTWLGLPGLPPFPITVWLMVVGLILFFLWALYRSFLSADRLAEFRAGFPTAGAAWLVLIAIALVCEFQPAVIAGMFDAADGLPAATAGQTSPGGLVGALLASSTKALVAFLAPIWVVVQFFSKQLGNIVAASDGGSRWRKLIASVVARLALWVAGLALPLLIWVGYLYLSYWGIANDRSAGTSGSRMPAGRRQFQHGRPER